MVNEGRGGVAGEAGPEGARGLVNRWINKRATAPFHPGFCKELLASSGRHTRTTSDGVLGSCQRQMLIEELGGGGISEEGLGGGWQGEETKGWATGDCSTHLAVVERDDRMERRWKGIRQEEEPRCV